MFKLRHFCKMQGRFSYFTLEHRPKVVQGFCLVAILSKTLTTLSGPAALLGEFGFMSDFPSGQYSMSFEIMSRSSRVPSLLSGHFPQYQAASLL